MPYTRQVFSFIETKLFTRLVKETMYPKNVIESIQASVLKKIREEIENA